MTIILFLVGLINVLPPEAPAAKTVDALYLSTDQGETWTDFSRGLPADVSPRNVLDHRGTLYLPTDNYGIFRLAPGKETWVRSNTGLPVADGYFQPLVLAAHGGTLVLGTYWRGVYISPDGGVTWYHPEQNVDNVVGALLYNEKYLLAGSHAGVWESTAHGQSWQRRGVDLTGINALSEHHGDVFVARQNGMGLLRGGKIIWSEMKTDWAIIQLLRDEEYVYALSANREIYRSHDGVKWESPCERGMIRNPKNLAQKMWNGYQPAPPSEKVPGMIVETSRGWTLTVGSGGC